VAVTVAEPAAMPVTKPADTVALDGAELDQDAVAVTSVVVESLQWAVATSAPIAATASDLVDGVTSIDSRVGVDCRSNR
jgi:hypothetical protein